MENYLELPRLFTPETIQVDSNIKTTVPKVVIAGMLWRHLHGDWGDWEHAHEELWKAGKALHCLYYQYTELNWIYIHTTANRLLTHVQFSPVQIDLEPGPEWLELLEKKHCTRNHAGQVF